MNRDSRNPASLRCLLCGREPDAAAGAPRAWPGTTYQIVVACASCGTSFVALSRN